VPRFDGAIPLIADVEGEVLKGGAELGFELPMQREPGEPAGQGREQRRAPAEDQRGAGAQTEPWVENPPPILGGGRGRVGGFSFPIAQDVPDAAQVTPFPPSAGTRVAAGKDRINSWVSSA